jgi:2-dehydro-3-deoxy-D-arabinonate dehydratase
MTTRSSAVVGLYRVALPNGTVRLANGRVDVGPEWLLAENRSISSALSGDGSGLDVLMDVPGTGPVPDGSRTLAPVDEQEVWAAGVTYGRSRDARMDESVAAASVYDRVYDADRPELFLKSVGWRARGPGAPIGIRADSTWDVPEPELAIVVAASGAIVGYTIGNDVSSRSIEGENPLYLPQAKIYDGACALGPCIASSTRIAPPFPIRLEIERDGARIFTGETSTSAMHRDFADIARWLVRAYDIPAGAFIMTGTGVVPPDDITLRQGDRVRVAISGLGHLENTVETVGGERP